MSFLFCRYIRTLLSEIKSYNTNLHIAHITSLDKRNFVYNCTIEWNACPPESRNVTRTVFKNNIAHLICK